MRRFWCTGVLASLLVAAALHAQNAPVLEIPAPTRVFYGLTPQFAVSPDATSVVFVADGPQPAMLWVRSLSNGATARPLTGTTQTSYPFWSADSKFIGFFAAGKLQKVAVAGAAPVIVCDAPNGRGGTWNANDVIVFTSGISDPLRKVSAAGGQPTPASVLDTAKENSHRFPQFLPDGIHILYWAGAGSAPATLKIGSLDSAEVVAVGPADTQGAYAGGHVFYGKGNVLMAQALDAATLQKSGDPIRVGDPLSGDAGSNFGSFSVATDGTLLYTRGAPRPFVLTWFDRAGRVLSRVGEPGLYTNVALSPDDKRIAVSLTTGTPPNRDIYILDAVTGAATRVTDHPAVDATPIWSPDGTKIAYSSQSDGPYQIYVRDLATGTDTLLFKSTVPAIATDWSRDGTTVFATRGTAASGLTLRTFRLVQMHPYALRPGREREDNASVSSEWVAFQASQTGRDEIHTMAWGRLMGGLNLPWAQVSQGGGTQPLWRRDGKELFFLASDGALMSAAIDGPPPARKLFSAPISLVIRRTYAVTSDGQRLLMPILDDRVAQTIAVFPMWTSRRSR